jgi:hypothetical protein
MLEMNYGNLNCKLIEQVTLGLMKEVAPRITMKRGLALALCALLLVPVVMASEGGVNKDLDIEGTQISAINTPSVSSDGEEFDITVTLDQENNVTGVSWTWQVCLNSGVCLAPVPEDMATVEGTTWVTTMTPVEDHSYVNYRITLEYADGNSSIYPEAGWGGKVWSDCWVAGEASGGDCDNGGLPGFTMLATVSVLGMMAIAVRRMDN